MNIHTEGNRNHSKTKNCPTSMTKATVGLDNGMWSWGQKKKTESRFSGKPSSFTDCQPASVFLYLFLKLATKKHIFY